MNNFVFNLPLSTIARVCDDYSINHRLVSAIISVESNGEQYAARYEPHYKWLLDPETHAQNNFITVQTEVVMQKTSFGLMQIMGAVAREHRFEGHLLKLTDMELNLEIGIEHLEGLIERYGTIIDAISAYNQGSPRKLDNGTYKNQYYVDSVMRRYEQLGVLNGRE